MPAYFDATATVLPILLPVLSSVGAKIVGSRASEHRGTVRLEVSGPGIPDEGYVYPRISIFPVNGAAQEVTLAWIPI